MIIDDDRAVRRILSGIIENNDLGEVVGEAEDGEEAEKKIIALKPDIALMDLLLPGKDGIEIIRLLRQKQLKTHFIMISQVEDQDLISRAYKNGIEFFIHKPINVIETVSVISKVEEIINLRNTFDIIKSTVINMPGQGKTEIPKRKGMTGTDYLLADVGILGETGSQDIKLIIENYNKVREKINNLQDIYLVLKEHYENTDKRKSADIKAIEMRIRRAIDKALRNVAALGIEDYDNDQFLRFSTTLFEFSEVKKEMDFLRGKATSGGKINIRKFLEGSALLCEMYSGRL